MLIFPALVSLSHALRDEHVLSVYIDGTARDPAARHVWRVKLDHSLKDLRTWLAESSAEERGQFEHCVALLDEQLARLPGAVGAPGWAAFITSAGVREAASLPVPMPTLAVWSTGMCIAPYIRVLKQSRPVVLVVADARKAKLYSYRAGALTPSGTVRAHVTLGPPLHMGDVPRLGFHSGVRGSPGSEAAQRALLEGTQRMLSEVSRRAADLAGADGWILIGGIPQVSAHAARTIGPLAPGRVLQLESLDVHASAAEISAAAQRGASTLRDEADRRRIAEIIRNGEPDDVGSLGPDATRHALEQLRVRELYLTPRYVEDHTAEAEDAVRAALDQGASVEQVSRAVAARLDEYGGVAARLRFRLVETEAATPDETTQSAGTDVRKFGRVSPNPRHRSPPRPAILQPESERSPQ